MAAAELAASDGAAASLRNLFFFLFFTAFFAVMLLNGGMLRPLPSAEARALELLTPGWDFAEIKGEAEGDD